MENAIGRDRAVMLMGSGGALFQLAMICAAAALPALCHLAGAPVTVLLPMHWPVIAAGFFCGWRAGLLAGAASPLISFALSGMPPAGYLPLMALELVVYGSAAGFAVERLRLKSVLALFFSVAVGRLVLLAAVAFYIRPAAGLWQYFLASMAPGLPAALAQVILLSMVYEKYSQKIL